MAARAMWKGTLRLGTAQVPVKLYSAVQDRDVRFTLLAPRTHAPVQQHMVKPESGEIVPYPQIQKGFEHEGNFVVLKREELSELAPKASRDIDVACFIPAQKLGAEWFVRPYYLGPDGAGEAYAALAKALFESEREGVAHWVMRNIEYNGALRSDGKVLSLITLRHADELVDLGALPESEARAHSEKEVKLAGQLIAAYAGEFDPDEFHNEHRERVLALIDAKAHGKRVRLKPLRQKKPEPNLLGALQKSLEHAQGESGAAKPKRARTARGRERHVA